MHECVCVCPVRFSFLLSFADYIWFEVVTLCFCVLAFFLSIWLGVVLPLPLLSLGVFLSPFGSRVLCILNKTEHNTNVHVPMVRALVRMLYGVCRCWRRIMLTSFIHRIHDNFLSLLQRRKVCKVTRAK